MSQTKWTYKSKSFDRAVDVFLPSDLSKPTGTYRDEVLASSEDVNLTHREFDELKAKISQYGDFQSVLAILKIGNDLWTSTEFAQQTYDYLKIKSLFEASKHTKGMSDVEINTAVYMAKHALPISLFLTSPPDILDAIIEGAVRAFKVTFPKEDHEPADTLSDDDC